MSEPHEAKGLQVRNLSAWHRPGTHVLEHVDIDAPRGSVTALLGPNGVGKSTLLKAIVGLVPCDGTIELGDDNLIELDPRERAKRVAYVPQRGQLDAPISVRRVVELGRFAHQSPFARLSRDDKNAVSKAMRDTGVEAVADRPFTELSGGEQQRVLIARALATEAEALLLDEPTRSLDVLHVLELHRVLHQLADRGTVVMIVLHDLAEVRRYADHTVLLSDKGVHSSGTSNEVVAKGPVHDVYGVTLIEGVGFGVRIAGGNDVRAILNGAGLISALVAATAAPLAITWSSDDTRSSALTPNRTVEDEPPKHIVDARQQRIPTGEYQRIVSLHGVADYALLHLVEPERLVAVSGHGLRSHPEGWRFGRRAGIDRSNQIEAVLARRPDLVIVSNFASEARMTRLREAGVVVFDLGPMHGVNTTLANINTLGQLLQVPQRARALAARYRRELRALDAAVPDEAMRDGLYLSIYGDTFFGGTKGSSYADLLHYGGVKDIAPRYGHREWPRYRLEELLAMDPALIVTQEGMHQNLCSRPLLKRMQACGPQGQVVQLPGVYHSDPGLGLVEAAASLLALVHPDSAQGIAR